VPYWVCHYHLIWSTFGREPTITPTVEPMLFEAIRDEIQRQKAILLALNSIPDHIHIAVSVPPSISIAAFVGRLKGASSHALNSSRGPDRPLFRWQEGYGVLTFGPQARDLVVDYILHQKEHHANQNLYSSMETSE
jgi:putative transposase